MNSRLVCAGIAILASALPAQDVESRPPGAESRPRSAKEQVAAIDGEFDDAQQEFYKLYGQAKTEQERNAVFAAHYPKPATWFPRLLEIAKADARGEGAEDALLWIVTHAQGAKEAAAAVDVLLRDHVASKAMSRAADTLANETTVKAEASLKTIEEKSPHREVKGRTVYARAEQKKNLASMALYLAAAKGDKLESLVKRYPAEELARLRAVDQDALAKDIEALLVRVQNEFADVEAGYGGTLGDRAEGDLFEIRNLAIGKVAPEIEGDDVFGKALKLSDHRGKVVVIDFWGHW